MNVKFKGSKKFLHLTYYLDGTFEKQSALLVAYLDNPL